jgi:hypothetical protein
MGETAIDVSVPVCGSARLDRETRGLPSLVRASLHYDNTEEEVDRFCQTLPSAGESASLTFSAALSCQSFTTIEV